MFKNKILSRADKMSKIKKRKFKNMFRRSDWYLYCFESHECLWNVTRGDYKDQNKRYPNKIAPILKRQKLTDKLTDKKNGYLRQKYGNFRLKTGRV